MAKYFECPRLPRWEFKPRKRTPEEIAQWEADVNDMIERITTRELVKELREYLGTTDHPKTLRRRFRSRKRNMEKRLVLCRTEAAHLISLRESCDPEVYQSGQRARLQREATPLMRSYRKMHEAAAAGCELSMAWIDAHSVEINTLRKLFGL